MGGLNYDAKILEKVVIEKLSKMNGKKKSYATKESRNQNQGPVNLLNMIFSLIIMKVEVNVYVDDTSLIFNIHL